MFYSYTIKKAEVSKEFIDDVIKLYRNFFDSGYIYTLDKDLNMRAIDAAWNEVDYKKGWQIYNSKIGSFVVVNDRGEYVYDHSILVCDEFRIDPSKINLCDCRFSFEHGESAEDIVSNIGLAKPHLSRDKFIQYSEFICEYEYLLMKYFFKYHGVLDSEDAEEIVILSEKNSIPLDLFFAKEYEDRIIVRNNLIEVTFDTTGFIIYENNRMFDLPDLMPIPREDIIRISHFIKKYGGDYGN